jgi:hypothetical protein
MRSCGRNRGNLLAADCQAFAAFRAAAFQHQPPVFRAHPHQEPVCFGAMAIIWLKRALTLHWSPLKVEPTMLAKGFKECQSGWFVLQSASFKPNSRSASNTCVFGLSPKFSTPVEKTVENRGKLPNRACKGPTASRLRGGENPPNLVSVTK